MDRCSFVGVGKDPGRNSITVVVRKMYILDTQGKIASDPRNTNRFLMSFGKLRGFRLNGIAWTFSGTVCVDPP